MSDKSVFKWLEAACEFIYGEDAYEVATLSKEGRLIALGMELFQLPPRSELSAVCVALSSDLGLEVADGLKLRVIVECILLHAVSERCRDQQQFVGTIMELEGKVQKDLMGVIQNNLEGYHLKKLTPSTSKRERVTEEGEEGEGMVMVEDAALSSSSSSSSLRLEMAETCMACVESTERLATLEEEYKSAVATVRELGAKEARLRSDFAAHTNKLVETELTVCEKEETIRDKQAEMSALQTQLAELKGVMGAKTALVEELSKLRDEVDILRPEAQRAGRADEKLQTLRERVDELVPLKEQIKDEAAAHKETHMKLLEAEGEVDELKKFRSQVEEYKGQFAEATIRADELAMQLGAREEELKRLSAHHSMVSDGNGGRRQEAEMLSTELELTRAQLRSAAAGGGGGIGEGLTELNPILMQELDRLRSENKDFKGKLDATSLESLDKLTKQLADEGAKAKSLHAKWSDTKNLLSAALAKISHLELVAARLEMDLVTERALGREVCNMAASDMEAAQGAWFHAHAHMQREHATTSAYALQQHTTAVTELRALLQGAEDVGTSLHMSLQSMTDTRDGLEEKLAQTLGEMDRQRRKAEDATEEKTKRIRGLEADVDEERLKRRRVEREKKIHETESHRYKMQSQAVVADGGGGGSGGMSVDAALKELTAMQTQLDTANSEVRRLRAQGGGSDGGDEDGAPGRRATHGSLRSGASGAVRIRAAPAGGGDMESAPMNGSVGPNGSDGVADRRMDQLLKERREMIAKGLQESKVNMEVQQKLLAREKEITLLKSKNTKLMLEKERLDRKYTKLVEAQASAASENTPPVNLL